METAQALSEGQATVVQTSVSTGTCAAKLAGLFGDPDFGAAMECILGKMFPEGYEAQREAMWSWLPLTMPQGGGMTVPGHQNIHDSLLRRGWKIIPARLPGGPTPRTADLWVTLDNEGRVTGTGWVGKTSLGTEEPFVIGPLLSAENRGERRYINGLSGDPNAELDTPPIAYFLRAPAGGCGSCGDKTQARQIRVPAAGGRVNGAAAESASRGD